MESTYKLMTPKNMERWGGVKNNSSWHLCAVGATLMSDPNKTIGGATYFHFRLR